MQNTSWLVHIVIFKRKRGGQEGVENKKIQINILIALITLICLFGSQRLMVGEALSKYEKSCLFMLVWLCVNQFFKD